MPIPGHPYLTDELDEQRSRQRAVLAAFPDQIVQNGPTAADPHQSFPRDAAAEMETGLRRVAAEMIEHHRALLDTCSAKSLADAAYTALVHEDRVGRLRWDMGAVVGGLRERRELPGPSDAERQDLYRLLQLLVLADRLARMAGDSYADHRLQNEVPLAS